MQAVDYPFVTELEVAFRDLDMLGHVNNAVYLSYTEQVRVKLAYEYAASIGVDYIPLIVGTTTIRYQSPAHLGEILVVGMGVSRWGNKSFDLAYQIDAKDGRAVANILTTMIYFDYETNRSTPIPEQYRAFINQRQGDWQLK